MTFSGQLRLLPTVIIIIVILSISTSLISTLPSGAPPAACHSLSPVHAFARTLPAHTSPFLVEAVVKRRGEGNDRIGNGQPSVVIQVNIIPKSQGSFPATFRGFIAQARLANNPGVIVDGAWLPQEPMLSKTFVCGGENRQLNTWTHSSALPKHRISALLVPPAGFSGQIVIQATVVATRDTFWEGLLSSRLNLVIHSPPPPPPPPSPTVPNAPLIIEQPAITELLDAVSYNVLDLEPDVDSVFYGIGDADEALYLSPKVGTDEDGVEADKKKTDKEGTSKLEADKHEEAKTSSSGGGSQCGKGKTTKKGKGNDLKVSDKSGDQCMNGGVEPSKDNKLELPLKKELTEDDLVVGDLEQQVDDWEEAFNFDV